MILATPAAQVNQPAVIRAFADFARHAVDETVASGHDRYDELWWLGYTVMYFETAYDETPVPPAGLSAADLKAWEDGVEMGQMSHLADIDAWADEYEPKDYQWEDEPTGCGFGHDANEAW